MEHRDQENRSQLDPVEQAVGESPEEDPTSTPVHHRELLGVVNHQGEPSSHSRQEFVPEPCSRPFVSLVRVFNVASGFRPDKDLACHRPVVRSRATMSSQGMPVAPSRSMVSSRRSSSARCEEVRGIDRGVSVRLSQSTSTKRSRSSTDRPPISTCGVDMAVVSHRPSILASSTVDAQRPIGRQRHLRGLMADRTDHSAGCAAGIRRRPEVRTGWA